MKPTLPHPPASFEAALQELESIVRTLEGGATPLEESLKAYERGIALRDYCQQTLGQAEQKIHLLENGVLRDFAALPGTPAETGTAADTPYRKAGAIEER
jgi:exodeoxyribonuclease VII small subunit